MPRAEEDFVECSECGHPVENHDARGCIHIAICACPRGFTVAEKREIRFDYGLPRHSEKWGT